MPIVNGIQSTPFTSLQPQVTPGGGSERKTEAQNASPAIDTYTGGSEPWRNKATSGGKTSYAAQAYDSQRRRISDEDQPDTGEPSPVQKQNDLGQEGEGATPAGPKGVDGEVLSQQEQAKLAELKKVDRVVRSHEQAHLAAAGSLVRRGISLSYEQGPDGSRYAVSGEVSIDTTKEADPADTITKMRTVRAAALAPADPSPQDRKVAAAATVTMNTAMHELNLARAAGEDGENVVARAAERMAGGTTTGDTKSQVGAPGEPGVSKSDQVSPRRSQNIQRYTTKGNAPSKRLDVTA